MSTKRALHFVLKISERQQTMSFFRDLLKMTPLRHEEFDEGCAASCNGPYDNRWSKTMIGYGPEDKHFVVELTYNYTIGSYKLGNDFGGLTVAVPNSSMAAFKEKDVENAGYVQAPDGYKFYYECGGDAAAKVTKCELACSNLKASVLFWEDLLGMTVIKETETVALLAYSSDQAQLQLTQITDKVDHGTAFGRIAFSMPADDLPQLEKDVKNAGHKILTPYVKLDTPGKASVVVVIIADPVSKTIQTRCIFNDNAEAHYIDGMKI